MPELIQIKSREHEQLISRLLSDRKKAEALKWLEGNSSEDNRIIGACKTNRDSIRFVKEIYDLGVVEIIAVQIRKKRGRKIHRTGKLVAKLPQDDKSRKMIFRWCKKQEGSVDFCPEGSIGFSPELDRGESHLFLLLD
jgi:hypothetical protein